MHNVRSPEYGVCITVWSIGAHRRSADRGEVSLSANRTTATTVARKHWDSINRESSILLAPPNNRPTYSLDSMHPCLHVDEILRHVASEVVASKGKGTAVALARCCKSFEDPVLDVLWETQEGLIPLFGSLPRGVWNDDECDVGAPTVFVLHSLKHTFPVFQKAPDEAGVGSIPRICPKDAKARRRWPFAPTIASSHGAAVSYLQRTFAPKPEISYVDGCRRGSRSLHPLVPFLRNRLRQSQF